MVDYPSREAELEIVRRHGRQSVIARLADFGLRAVADGEALREMRAAASAITLSDELIAYMVDLVRATRNHASLEVGASPRAASMLAAASRARAVLEGRDFAIPDDVKSLAVPALSHRIVPTARADIEGFASAKILRDILDRTPAPR